ncbi:hypothetical protein KKI43_02130 [Arthrobacter sp. GN70]|uniref:Exo-alpha-sialidase n=2 Tax=Arthrobacter TaxID=1663 RepID=A0A4R5KK93_9MICC|nr:hypothetical protein [Arthrobacter sp. GN70]TDF94917.1 hypothetical protein E1809_12895 [Arthrobacter terricola]
MRSGVSDVAAAAGVPVKAFGFKTSGVSGALPTAFPKQGSTTVTAAIEAPRIVVKTTSTAPRLPASPLSWRGLDRGFYPHSVGIDGAIYGHTDDPTTPATGYRTLAWTTDGGITLQLGQNFGHLVDEGEYVLWTGRTTAGFVVITSSDVTKPGNWGSIWFSTSATAGFTKVRKINGTDELSISHPKPGPDGKTILLVGEYSTDIPQPVHSLWMSRDGGLTWSNIKTAKNVDHKKNAHFHGTEYDQFRNRIWSSQGDNDNSMWAFSDDWGISWTNVPIPTTDPLYQADSAYQQPTLIIPFADRLAVTPDRGTFAAGIWTLNSSDGTTPRVAWASVAGERAPFTYGRAPYVHDGDEAIVAIVDRTSGSNSVYIVGTGDSGASWHLLSKIPTAVTGTEGSGIVGPDLAGRVMWRSWGNNPEPYGHRLMVADKPTWV